MQTSLTAYEMLRPKLRTGMLIFFEGSTGVYSWFIRTFTKPPTHVGMLVVDDAGNVVVYEALSQGVVKNFASQRIEDYQGRVWICDWHDWVWQRLNLSKLIEYLVKANKARYSWVKAILSGVGFLTRIPGRSIGKSKFCSELVNGAVEYAGYDTGSDDTPTPHQVSRWDGLRIAWQVKGEPKEI